MQTFASFFSSKASLQGENEELRAELAQTAARAADRDQLYAENIALKEAFNRPDSKPDIVLAAVLARPPALPYDTLLIDAGLDHGLLTGDLVSAGGGALIGQVTEVYSTSARVALFSSSGESHQGMLRGTVPVTVEGRGGGGLSAEVPAGTPAAIGDAIEIPVISANLSEVVAGIDAPQGNSFKTLYLHLPVNVLELRFVEVWRAPTSVQ